MNPGEVWELPDGGRLVVVSLGAYNARETGIGRVISVPLTEKEEDFTPFAVETPLGVVRPDRIMNHPRGWLTAPVARLSDEAYAQVRAHLAFLLGLD